MGCKRKYRFVNSLHFVDKICINEPLQGPPEILFTCSVLYMTEDKSAVLFCKLPGNCVPDEGEFGYVVFWYVLGEIKGIALENLFVDFVNTGDIVMCYPVPDRFGHSAGNEVFPAKVIKQDHNLFHQRLTWQSIFDHRDERSTIVCLQEFSEVHGAEGEYIDFFNRK